jgi:hypothetical protein
MALIDKLNNLGDAVRERSGREDKMTLDQMAIVIKTLPGGNPVVEETTITENGTYEPNEGVDGFSKVIVEVPIPEDIPAVVEAITITENGTYTAPVGVDGYSPITVDVPTGGGDIEVEPIVLNGDCSYGCAGAIASCYIKLFGDTISTTGVNSADHMFYNSTVAEIPFDIYITKTIGRLNHLFNYSNIEVCPKVIGPNRDIPTGAYSGTVSMEYIFAQAKRLRNIPYDFFWKMIPNKEYWDKAKAIHSANRQYMFEGCHSLRALPDVSMLATVVASYGSINTSALTSCYALDEVINWPISGSYTSNTFSGTINNCYRLADFIFETNEDGTVKTAQWKSQTIDFSKQAGWSDYAPTWHVYNSGITADKEVKDDATYQALKNDPDWFASNINYSRYNHDSAVRTIASLPDCSATGTNTIKFKGAAGSLTDGGAINTLTEAEIAVAAAKGWTITLV